MKKDLNENLFLESENTTRWSILGGIVGVTELGSDLRI